MAHTTVPADMTVEQWDSMYFEEFVNRDFFKKFSSSDSNAMIHVKEELVDKPGNKVHLTLVNEINRAALRETDTFEGNESRVVMRDFAIEIGEYGLPVKFKHFEAKKTAIDLRQAHRGVLQSWNRKLHRDKVIEALGEIDGVVYASATETQKDTWVTNNVDRVLFGANLSNTSAGDHSASLANIDSTNDKLTPDALSLMRYMAKNPSGTRPKVRPIEARAGIDDSDHFCAFVPSLVMRDIKANATFIQANREARDRGTKNPLFANANWIWDNIALYEIEEIAPLAGVGAAGIQVAPVYLCGAQAIGVAWGKRPWTTEETFDYKRYTGLAIQQWYEVRKLRFGTGANDKDNPVDHGVVTGFFSATPYA